MTIKIRVALIVTTVTLISMQVTTAFAGTVTIPNTFTSGASAKAADVNANFTAVAVGVNGNAQDIATMKTQDIATLKTDVQALKTAAPTGVMVNVAGAPVGVLFTAFDSTGINGSSPVGGTQVLAVNSKNFILPMSTGSTSSTVGSTTFYYGQIEGSLLAPAYFFDQANCAGNRFVAVYGVQAWYARQGIVFGAANPLDANQSYMVKGAPTVATPVSVQVPVINSSGTLQAPQCLTVAAYNVLPGVNPPYSSPAAYKLISAMANDSAITGVSASLVGAVTLTVE